MSWASITKTYVLLCSLWAIDFAIKFWFINNPDPLSFGLFHLSYTENHGIMLGGFSELPLILKAVFLSTTGIALVAGFPLTMALYRFRSKLTVYGLAILLSGILGNVTDRVIYGFVVDYIYLQTSFFTTPVLNFADMVQWFGYGFLTTGLYKEISHQLPDDDKRKWGGWVNNAYQVKFCLSLLTIYLAVGFTFMAFGFTFLKYSFLELVIDQAEIQRYLKFYCLTALVLLTFSSLLVLYVGKIISHRIAGPSFAIRRYITDTLMGLNYPLKLRENDHLAELEEPLTELNNRFTHALEEVQEIPEIPEEIKRSA